MKIELSIEELQNICFSLDTEIEAMYTKIRRLKDIERKNKLYDSIGKFKELKEKISRAKDEAEILNIATNY